MPAEMSQQKVLTTSVFDSRNKSTEAKLCTLNVRRRIHLGQYGSNVSPWTLELEHIKKGKPIPLQAWTDHEGSRRMSLPDFMTFGT